MRLILLALLCLGGAVVPPDDPAAAQGPGGDTKRKPHFTIGKETTFVTGPVDREGYIDYVAFLNERLRRGVTLENNANVLLWKAFGPHPNQVAMPAEFFKLLGMAAPPERGDYFVDHFSYMKAHYTGDPEKQLEEIDALMERTGERPWKGREYPKVASWLKENEKPLALVIEATKRSHYYAPLVPRKTDKEPGGLGTAVMIDGLMQSRKVASALVTRALLHAGEGRHKEAWQDLLACHRLGRHVARGGSLIHCLVAVAIDSIAGAGDLAYLDHVKMDAMLMNCLRDLQKLPAMPALADIVDGGERLWFLDDILMVDRYGLRAIGLLAPRPADKGPDPQLQKRLSAIDWDPVLRNGNRLYDRVVAAMRLKDRQAREKNLDEIDSEIKKPQSDRLKDSLIEDDLLGLKALRKALDDPEMAPADLAKAIGAYLPRLYHGGTHRVQTACDRMEQIERNLHVAFALAAYQRDNGQYPQKLEALAPRYLAIIPQDLFTGKPLVYLPAGNGYLLYSFGVNGQDDQGRTYGDDPSGDDLPVRMPLPPRKN